MIKLLNKKLIKWQYIPMLFQWRRKVPKGVCVGGGGGTQTRNLCTFGKEPI